MKIFSLCDSRHARNAWQDR